MRKKIIIGNWKMNKNRKETINYLMTLNHMLNKNHLLSDNVDVCLAPSTLCLIATNTYINRGGLFAKNSLRSLIIAAQDCDSEIAGSETGSISFMQLHDEGINACIVGHFETRRNHHLTDEQINKKVISLTNNNMLAILCVGDTLEQKTENLSKQYVLEQIEKGLKGVIIDNLDKLVIAYEPIYAIGASNPVEVLDIEDMIKTIRNKLAELYNQNAANSIRIIYGGSINSANYIEYAKSDEIDGLLIGKSSLDVTSFYDISYGVSQALATKYPTLGNKYYTLKQKEIEAISKPIPEPKKEKQEVESIIKNDIDAIEQTKESAIDAEENK